MFDQVCNVCRRPAGLLVLALAPVLGSCLPQETTTLDALTDVWSDSTLHSAEPSITAALIVAGLTSELCRLNITPEYWASLEAGDQLPLSYEMDNALGSPFIDVISVDGSTQVTLAGVLIMDRVNAFLRFTIANTTESYALNVDVLDGRNDVPFGQLRMSIAESCEGTVSNSVWVSGEALWTDLTGLTHNLILPADDDLSVGVNLDCGFIPNAGTLSWQGSIDGQVRSIITNDAADISLDASAAAKDTAGGTNPGSTGNCEDIHGYSHASWPATIRGDGGGWESERDITVPITP